MWVLGRKRQSSGFSNEGESCVFGGYLDGECEDRSGGFELNSRKGIEAIGSFDVFEDRFWFAWIN